MYDLTTTIVGNLVRDPELRFTSSGTAVVRFTVAHTPRTRNPESGEWVDGEPTFLDCTAWRQLAENIAESLTKGARVIVTGRLRTQRWETEQKEKRSRIVLEVNAAGPELMWATARVARMTRNGAGSGPVDDPWSSASPFPPEHATPTGEPV